MSSTRKHAILSASAAHRWLACPPSARLEETLPETTSEYAREGSLAHELAELKLRRAITDTADYDSCAYETWLEKLQSHELYQNEMMEYTDDYVDYIQSIAYQYEFRPHIIVEKKLDFSAYVPQGFGTGDCIIIGGNTLHVIDFKYGKGVAVSADNNPQMMLYALGALMEYSFIYDIHNIVMNIHQPRLSSVSEFTMTAEELRAWGEGIKPIAEKAIKGEGEFMAGDHCRFCRAKARCRARSESMTALEVYGKVEPALLTNDEIGEILQKAGLLKKWAEDVEEYALSALISGEDIKGWKAVEGRSNRAFTNVDEAFKKLLSEGVEEALLYERKPITLTATEKLVGKKTFADLLSEYVIKPPGKPTLAPETDKREAINNRISAADVFSEIK